MRSSGSDLDQTLPPKRDLENVEIRRLEFVHLTISITSIGIQVLY